MESSNELNSFIRWLVFIQLMVFVALPVPAQQGYSMPKLHRRNT